jgi:catechol 2,3-dioxygenase-like lactoylglutathione lyase family enzyme
VHFITLGVSDLVVSRRFYAEGLGWQPTMDLPGVITFFQVAPGVLLGIWPLDELAADSGGPMAHVASFALAQNVDSEAEVDTVFARAVAAGATALKEPQHASFGGYHAYVADPDGHRWEIAHNPGWSVDDDGTVRLGPVPPPT